MESPCGRITACRSDPPPHTTHPRPGVAISWIESREAAHFDRATSNGKGPSPRGNSVPPDPGRDPALDANIVATYPNGDPGSLEIIRVLKEFARRRPITVYQSLPEDKFLDLLSSADVLVGNSSSGIIEAPSLKVPTINVGDRQNDRERGGNVIDVPHDAAVIRKSV